MVVIGDVVLFHTKRGDRPAIVTQVWSDETVNLYVFPDGTYDTQSMKTITPGTCMTSVVRGEGENQWTPRTVELTGQVLDVSDSSPRRTRRGTKSKDN